MNLERDHSAYLRLRNDLWRELRPLEPTDARFEPLLEELRQLTGWTREKILESLGLDPAS